MPRKTLDHIFIRNGLTLGKRDDLHLNEVEVSTDLATDGATTNITGTVPAGSLIVAESARITTAVADAGGGTAITVTRTGGNTDQAISLGGLTAGTTGKRLSATAVSSATGYEFEIQGAGDLTPSAGTILLRVQYLTLDNLTA